jgi:hypothetical protein
LLVSTATKKKLFKQTAALGGRQRGGGGLPSKDDIVGSTQDPRGRNWSTVSILYYPWYSDIEVSDAWTRRGKPAMETVRYRENMVVENKKRGKHVFKRIRSEEKGSLKSINSKEPEKERYSLLLNVLQSTPYPPLCFSLYFFLYSM